MRTGRPSQRKRLKWWVLGTIWVWITCPEEHPALNVGAKCDKPRYHDGRHHCAAGEWS